MRATGALQYSTHKCGFARAERLNGPIGRPFQPFRTPPWGERCERNGTNRSEPFRPFPANAQFFAISACAARTRTRLNRGTTITDHRSGADGRTKWNGSNLSSGKDSPEGKPGLIVHYDIMRPYLTKAEDYREDYALASLLSAPRATILTIRIERDRLLRQYRSRGSVFARLGLGRKLPLTAIYENEDRLAEWSAKWNTFCAELQRQRPGITLIAIQPGHQNFAFELAEPSPPSVNPTVA
jgi:hypothetical protein